MTQNERSDLKKALIEALNSREGQEAIVGALSSESGQEAIVGALSSESGQEAIVGALSSESGQEAIKNGALKALESEEGKKIFSDLFVDNFKEVVVPAFENHEERIIKLERQQLTA